MAWWAEYFEALVSIFRDKERLKRALQAVGRGAAYATAGIAIGSILGGVVGAFAGASVGGLLAGLWDKIPSLAQNLQELLDGDKERLVQLVQALAGVAIPALIIYVSKDENLCKLYELVVDFLTDVSN